MFSTILDRRKFLALGTSATAAVLLRSGRAEGGQDVGPADLRWHSSVDGLLAASLEARPEWIDFAGKRAYLSTYNGLMPGPLFEAKPGDTVRIRFKNSLLEPTNLHFHGLQISPVGNGDNPFLHIPPGELQDYEFSLPSHHPAGLFWYHPHLHGLVSRQLFLGMAGLFVVRGEVDRIPEIAAATEYFMVLKDLDLNRDGTVPPNTTMDWMYGRQGDIFTVNGELNPLLIIQRGGLIRLRILNATNAGFYRLTLENHPFYLIGTDGGAIPEPLEKDEIFLAPGQRVDLLVRGVRDAGSFRLFAKPDAGAFMGMGSMGMGMTSAQPGNTQIAATVFYQGDAAPGWSLPNHLADIPALPAPMEPRRSFILSQRGMMGRRIAFLINGRSFNPDRIDTAVRLNHVEDWEIINANMMAHPFHLHTNPFQVLDSDGEPERAWRDVVLVEAGERVRIRVRFSDYPGRTVYHCHIPEHEDLGMMGVIEMQE